MLNISFNQNVIRVCKFKESAEALELQNSMDMAIGLGKQLRQIQTGRRYMKPSPIHAFTNSKPLVMYLRAANQPVRVQIKRIKGHLDSQDIESLEWVAIKKMLSDPLTRQGDNTTALSTVLRTGRWERPT